jgi:hypothetical protein
MITLTPEQMTEILRAAVLAHVEKVASWPVNEALRQKSIQATETVEVQQAMDARISQLIREALEDKELEKRIRSRVVQNIELRLTRKLKKEIEAAKYAELMRMKGEA